MKSRQEARAFRPNQFLTKWGEVEQTHTEVKQTITEQTEELSASTADFFEHILGFKLQLPKRIR